MRRLSLVLLTLGVLTSCAQGDPPIPWQESRQYIGQTKTVCGLVSRSGKVAGKTATLDFGTYAGPPSFDEMMDIYAGDAFIARINDLSKFPKDWRSRYVGKSVCVKGLIEFSIQAAYIAVDSPDQITIKR